MSKIFFFLLGLTLLMAAQSLEYTTVGDCATDEICPRYPDTVCKLDCLYVNDQGQGSDCVNHFYDENGNIVYHCWE